MRSGSGGDPYLLEIIVSERCECRSEYVNDIVAGIAVLDDGVAWIVNVVGIVAEASLHIVCAALAIQDVVTVVANEHIIMCIADCS